LVVECEKFMINKSLSAKSYHLLKFIKNFIKYDLY